MQAGVWPTAGARQGTRLATDTILLLQTHTTTGFSLSVKTCKNVYTSVHLFLVWVKILLRRIKKESVGRTSARGGGVTWRGCDREGARGVGANRSCGRGAPRGSWGGAVAPTRGRAWAGAAPGPARVRRGALRRALPCAPAPAGRRPARWAAACSAASPRTAPASRTCTSAATRSCHLQLHPHHNSHSFFFKDDSQRTSPTYIKRTQRTQKNRDDRRPESGCGSNVLGF